MLKIKDNVDLKELEKFGFKDVEPYLKTSEVSLIAHNTYYMENTEREDKNRRLRIVIEMGTREIDIDPIIYDLIKADLVEKVSDEE